MNRIDRISAILIQLQSKRVVKAQDIATRFRISLRTVYRDIRSLEQDDLQLVVIRIDKAFAIWLDHQKYYSGFISETEAGGEMEMTFLSSSLDGFARWYMMFGEHATIIEPEILKKKVRSRLSAISLKV